MMMNDMDNQNDNNQTRGPWFRIIISLAILFFAIGGLLLIFTTEPKAERVGASKKTAMLVETSLAERGDFHPVIDAMGVVRPSREISLKSQVSGELISISDKLIPGGFAKKGERLLQIDPFDYRNILAQKKAAHKQARAEVELEMGKQQAAKNSFELLNEPLPDNKKALVLRKPQLEALEAKAQAAKAAVDQAERNLRRTTIKAPFDAHIISRNINLGSQVSSGGELAKLVGVNTYWIETSIPLSRLRWLDFPDGDGNTPTVKGSEVEIRNRTVWPEGAGRKGELLRLVGALDNKTRLAKVLIKVDDPLARHNKNNNRKNMPKLMIGSFVEVKIKAHKISNVVRISSDYLRKDDTVWIMKDKKLDIRSVKVALKDSQFAYITDGLSGGEHIITTNLASIIQGAPLRTKADIPAVIDKNKKQGDGRKGKSNGKRRQ